MAATQINTTIAQGPISTSASAYASTSTFAFDPTHALHLGPAIPLSMARTLIASPSNRRQRTPPPAFDLRPKISVPVIPSKLVSKWSDSPTGPGSFDLSEASGLGSDDEEEEDITNEMYYLILEDEDENEDEDEDQILFKPAVHDTAFQRRLQNEHHIVGQDVPSSACSIRALAAPATPVSFDSFESFESAWFDDQDDIDNIDLGQDEESVDNDVTPQSIPSSPASSRSSNRLPSLSFEHSGASTSSVNLGLGLGLDFHCGEDGGLRGREDPWSAYDSELYANLSKPCHLYPPTNPKAYTNYGKGWMARAPAPGVRYWQDLEPDVDNINLNGGAQNTEAMAMATGEALLDAKYSLHAYPPPTWVYPVASRKDSQGCVMS